MLHFYHEKHKPKGKKWFALKNVKKNKINEDHLKYIYIFLNFLILFMYKGRYHGRSMALK